MLSESAVVSFFPAVDRFLQNPWADERPQHPQLLCSENWGRVLRHSMCLPQENMIYHHIIIIFPLKHPFGGGENGGFSTTHFQTQPYITAQVATLSESRLAAPCTAVPTAMSCYFRGNPLVSESVNIARWVFWRFQKSYQ